MSEKTEEKIPVASNDFWCGLLLSLESRSDLHESPAYKALLLRVGRMTVDSDRWPELSGFQSWPEQLSS